MQTFTKGWIGICIMLFASITWIQAQHVGIATNNPQAPFQVYSSGQVNTPGGLQVLGDTTEGHLRLDFDFLQARDGALPLLLRLQPSGGDLRIGSNLLHLNATNGFVGIGTITPDQKLELEGSADQYLRVHTTSSGGSRAGVELLRSTEFSATDWRLINDGGTLKFFDGIDNFMTEGDLNMMITSAGNVGIGIDPPASRLHLAGATDQFIKVHRTTAGAGMAGIDLLRDTEFSATDWRIVNDGGALRFLDATNNFTGAAEVDMTLTQSGSLGIGIESPQALLHVVGSDVISETGNGLFQIGDPSGLHIRYDNNEILARNADNASLLFLQFWSGNLSLCDDNLGRVGIGNGSPQGKLHVTDGEDVTLASGGELVLGSAGAANLAMDGNEIQARSNGAASALFMQTSGGDVLMVPNETGQVGIGVTSSATMPSNDYLLAVDGRIISEEVRVEISGSWPDYVFQPGYNLMSLPELEQQILSTGHLPGIPSATQVESEGILLGDTQRAMLEKIEELTLYVIQLQKEIDSLKQKINE